MALNVTKTEIMVVATKQRLARLQGERIQVNIGGKTIKTTDEHKLLGLVLDESLDWNLHTDMICKRVSKGIALLKSIKCYLPLKSRQSFYKTLIQPTIDYACVVWGNTSKSNIDLIIRLQNYAARVILDIRFPQQVPSLELFGKLKWMTFPQRTDYFTLIQMYKIVNNMGPEYLTDRFVYTRDMHEVNTRNAADGKLRIPKLSTSTGRKSFSYRGVKIWNNLATGFKDLTLSTFRKSVTETYF